MSCMSCSAVNNMTAIEFFSQQAPVDFTKSTCQNKNPDGCIYTTQGEFICKNDIKPVDSNGTAKNYEMADQPNRNYYKFNDAGPVN